MNEHHLRLYKRSGHSDRFVCVTCGPSSRDLQTKLCRAGIHAHTRASLAGQLDDCYQTWQLEHGRWKERARDTNHNLYRDVDSKRPIGTLGLFRWKIDRQIEKHLKLKKTSLLEFAVWKVSCLWLDGSMSFSTMQEILDQRMIGESFDPVTYKQERRLTGSVSAIMHGVVEFLEWMLVILRKNFALSISRSLSAQKKSASSLIQ